MWELPLGPVHFIGVIRYVPRIPSPEFTVRFYGLLRRSELICDGIITF